MDSDTARSASAVRTDPPPAYWGDHDANVLDRLEPRWVVATWAMCVGVGLVFAALATVFATIVSEAPITGESGSNLGLLTIIAAMSTFFAFAVTLTLRLVRVDHDRLVNSLAVAFFHVVVAAVIFLLTLALEGFGVSLDDDLVSDLANALAVFERSAVAAILGAFLAVGMVPARGERPTGVQTGATPQDRQL